MVSRSSPFGVAPILMIAVSVVVMVGSCFVERPPQEEVFKEASPAPTTGVAGSGISFSREPMAAPSTDLSGCDPCIEPVKEATATMPAATPTTAPTSTPSPTPSPTPPPHQPDFPVAARAVAILEAPCGAFLFGKAEHESLAPASLTKIVTALAAIDRVQLSDSVDVHISAKELKRRTRSSVMGLEPGMTVTVEDLLYGLFLPSGNDAALALAEHVSGDVESFVTLMNEEAGRLGLKESHFSNPHGLDSKTLRSSAYDMARAGMEMMKNDTLAVISSAASYSLPGGLSFNNGNRLLGSYPGAYGVKIGYTNDAGHTIVAAAARNDRDLYIAVFGSEDLYGETARLLDWAFEEIPAQCNSG